MEHTYFIIALVSAGIAIPMCILCVVLGIIDKNHKDYLFFGLMSFLLAGHLLSPPLGFIIHASAPYTLDIEFKRVFIFSYYMLIPLFVAYYTGYYIKSVYYVIGGLVVACYIGMTLSTGENSFPLWAHLANVIFLLNLIYGIKAGLWQLKNGNKKDSYYLLFSMVVFAVLFFLTLTHSFIHPLVATQNGEKVLFFPFHLHSISFFAIIGCRFFQKSFEKYRVEKLMSIRNTQWNSLVQMAPLIVVELDEKGNILDINEFGCKVLGIDTREKILGESWLEKFSLPQNKDKCQRFIDDLVKKRVNFSQINSKLKKSDGKNLLIYWHSFLIETDEGESNIVMCIGQDITDDEIKSERILTLKKELEKETLSIIDSTSFVKYEFLGQSQAFKYVLQKINVVANTQVPVLIEGETGVGKELVADLIFKNSARADKPFIKINCGAFPRELIEDELFGHEKGAFTSAIQARKGRFEMADGGTIFLDEIGELPIDMQPRLLRVLQDGQFERIGGQTTIKVNVRIIAATNRKLVQEISSGHFREDLYYRLNVFPITIPPLRKRKEDQKLLIDHYISLYSLKYKKNLLNVSKADMQRLMDYDWPGNVRELKNMIERSVISSEGVTLKINWLIDGMDVKESPSAKSLEIVEHDHIVRILMECNWKINGSEGAAEKLSMHPNTLRSKMKKLGIKRPV